MSYNPLMNSNETLKKLTAGMPLLHGGNQVTCVSQELASAFKPGDRLIVVESNGDLLHIPSDEYRLASQAVEKASLAFSKMGSVTDEAITGFYEAFARRLDADESWTPIQEANAKDVARAKERGRSTTRLKATEKLRNGMVVGLREWRDAPGRRGQVLDTIEHDGWLVEQVVAPLGVVAFVFEGRPNVFADATGVLRGGNTVVFRIGSDALGTAKAIVKHALNPALQQAGLPEGAATLVESASHASGWALFSDRRLALAVARGSGRAVAQLGSVARQSGVSVSLHGTGGAWIVADTTADADRFAAAVLHSLDRKVCNTLNTCCIPRERVDDLVPRFLHSLQQAGEKRGHGCKLHVAEGDESAVPQDWFATKVAVRRAEGDVEEPQAESIPVSQLGHEWEWEETPEVTLKIVEDMDEAVALYNQYSPQFVVSFITESEENWQRFYDTVNAPFVGNGFTRWVDGQYALNRPELGLSNWENGRLFARGGILSGDGVFTVRTVVRQTNPDVHR